MPVQDNDELKQTADSGEQPGSSSDRRDFLKQVATAAAVGSAMRPLQAASAPGSPVNAGESAITFPRKFSGEALRTLAFPLGGIGTGSISLGGRGELRDWEIFNRPDKGYTLNYSFPSIWAKPQGAEPVARVLEARIAPPFEGSSGLGSGNVPGLPRLNSATFTGEFPFARVEFEDAKLPVKVGLEAWSPFIPLDDESSGLPVAVLRYRVRNSGSRAAEVSIAYTMNNPVGEISRLGAPGRRNVYRESGGVRGLLMDNPFMGEKDYLNGSFAVGVLEGGGEVTHLTGWRGGSRWRVGPLALWDDFSSDGRLDQSLHPVPQAVGSLCLTQTIEAGDEKTYTFLLAWRFPNRTPDRCGWGHPWSQEGVPDQEQMLIGNHYCQQYSDAWQAAEAAASRLDELEAGTRDFAETMKASSLPPAVLDAAMSNLSTLRTNTCFRTADGGFHVFEGCNDHAGCCFGSCTHVWNYESMFAFLFPRLSRSLREHQFGWAVDERGLQDFRYYLPYGRKRWGTAAADGQMGTIMKLYLDWKLSGDTEWMRGLWPNAKRALEFAWVENGWDADRDGVMEGAQHNTYDIEFFGPNPLSGIWYLGALRAGEEMAGAVGDNAAADEYHRLFERGKRWIDANLFNGEFFIQKVQGRPAPEIAEGLMWSAGAADTEEPDFQMGEGCLADQVLGQYFARITGLGDLVDASHCRRALESIYRHNFKRDLSDHESVQRTYALNEEAGLLLCDYAGRERPGNPFPYYAEVWTGIEYQVASHMFYEGLVEQGLELFEAVRKRHDGARRNPWNEPECGHHYGRALAAWSGILSLCGFDYSAVNEAVAVSPRMGDEVFRGFWSVPSGWGALRRDKHADTTEVTIEARRGELACRRLKLGAVEGTKVEAQLGGRRISAQVSSSGGEALVTLQSVVRVTPDASLRIVLS